MHKIINVTDVQIKCALLCEYVMKEYMCVCMFDVNKVKKDTSLCITYLNYIKRVEEQ